MLKYWFLGFLLGFFAFIVFLLSFFVGILIWIRFIIFIVAVFTFIFLTVVIMFYGPARYKYKLEDWDDKSKYYNLRYDKSKWNVVLDTHTHTCASDGKLTIEQCIKYHQSVGFNACVITEHNTMKNMKEVLEMKEKYKNEFIVIPGIEYTTLRVHLCLIGITEWDCINIPMRPANDQIKQVITEVHNKGGVVAVCHYPWSTWVKHGSVLPRMTTHPSREQMLEWGVDLIECANWDDDISLVDYESYNFANEHPEIAPCVGTDMHEPYKNPLCGWTLINAEDFTCEAVMNELRNHRTKAILKPEGVKYPINHASNPWFHVLRPIINLGEKFEESLFLWDNSPSIDVAGLSSWLIYFFLFFLFVEFLRIIGL